MGYSDFTIPQAFAQKTRHKTMIYFDNNEPQLIIIQHRHIQDKINAESADAFNKYTKHLANVTHITLHVSLLHHAFKRVLLTCPLSTQTSKIILAIVNTFGAMIELYRAYILV